MVGFFIDFIIVAILIIGYNSYKWSHLKWNWHKIIWWEKEY